jgi:DNA-directed RNA polymerase alpha subunit
MGGKTTGPGEKRLEQMFVYPTYLTTIDDLDVPIRIKNVLKKYSIKTVKELMQHSLCQLLYLYGFGAKSARYLEQYLARHGILLKKGTIKEAHRWALRKGYIKHDH